MERVAVVFDKELDAIKNSRDRELPLFSATNENKQVWIVAVSEHQAQLALVNYIWPMFKLTKKFRDIRYMKLLEEAVEKSGEETKEE